MEKPTSSQEISEISKEVNISLVVCSYSKTEGLLVLVDTDKNGKKTTLHNKGIPDPKTLCATLEDNNQTDIDPYTFKRGIKLLMDNNLSKDFVYVAALDPKSIDNYCQNHPSSNFIPIDQAINEIDDEVSRKSFIRVKEGEEKFILPDNYYDFQE